MWIKLTLKTGTETSIDFSKVLYISRHSEGTQIFFEQLYTDEKSTTRFKSIVVKQDISKIDRMLKPKFIS